jgi:beta-lactamase class C
MPLQVPDGIDNNAKLIAYYKTWKPAYAPGTDRTYSNLSIGLLGVIAAKTMHADYATLLQNQMFPALGLYHSFMSIPADQAANYAQGYEDDDTPIRMVFDPLTPETGGVRITAGDLLRFLAINMGVVHVDAAWQQAVMATHTGYFQTKSGGMVQDLVWEQYRLPLTRSALEAGNSYQTILNPHPVTVISPPLLPRMDVLLDKTGSTNGFGAYVAFIPANRLAVVILANKNYPIPARVSAAYNILTGLNADISQR